jgi:hypothetical protein
MKTLTQQELLDIMDRLDELILHIKKFNKDYHIVERLLEIRNILE